MPPPKKTIAVVARSVWHDLVPLRTACKSRLLDRMGVLVSLVATDVRKKHLLRFLILIRFEKEPVRRIEHLLYEVPSHGNCHF
jgi:hypothetical protein